jgi:hypothetical protein
MVKVIILLFRFVSEVFGYLGYIETPKQAVPILKRNNRKKRLVSDSAETNFGFSFDISKQNLFHIYIYIYIYCGHLRTPLAMVRPVGCTQIIGITVGAVYITNAKSITNDCFAVFFPMKKIFFDFFRFAS